MSSQTAPHNSSMHSAQSGISQFVGHSLAMRRLLEMTERLAQSDRPVLVQGPTGAGKEVTVRLLHRLSPYAEHPLVDVNCGAIPEHLMEAELFGHTKGAFTGAHHAREGLLTTVGNGTLFFDEIGELPLTMQAKLLRAIETREFRPLGSETNAPFKGRVVAATHRDLPSMVESGAFRQDLYYRLAVFVLQVPSLSERKEDIPDLVAHFVSRQKRTLQFTPEAMRMLTGHHWPGNVRELRNLIDQLSLLLDCDEVQPNDLTPYLSTVEPDTSKLNNLVDTLLQLGGENKITAVENLMIDRVLELNRGNKTAAGRALGISRKAVERRLNNRLSSLEEGEKNLEKARELVEQSSFLNAVPQLQNCLKAFEAEEDSPALQRHLFDTHRLLSTALRGIHGWLHPDAMTHYQTALKLGETVCSASELAAMQFGVWVTQLISLELVQARSTAQNMLQRALVSGDASIIADAHMAIANTLYWLGDCKEVIAELERGGLGLKLLAHASLADENSVDENGADGLTTPPLTSPQQITISSQGIDIYNFSINLEGIASYQNGDFDRAHRAYQVLVQRCEDESSTPFHRVFAYQGATWLACLFNDADALQRLSADMQRLANEHGFLFYEGIAQFFYGCSLALQEQWTEAETAMRAGYLDKMLQSGGRAFHSFYALYMSKVLRHARRDEDCEDLLDEALDLAMDRHERVLMADFLVGKAHLAWQNRDPIAYELHLRNAINNAQLSGNVPAQLEAVCLLTPILKQANKADKAIALLQRALRDVIDTDNTTSCVRKARTLLSTLESGNAKIA